MSYFLSADWSKCTAKRSVYLADVRKRRIEKCVRSGAGWDLNALLEVAEDLSRDGSVLVGADVALGVPEGCWRLVLDKPLQRAPESFIEWLGGRGDVAGFFETVEDPDEWHVNRPWFKVQKGLGGLKAFTGKAGGMRRKIENATNAKPLFAVLGIPGTVGSGTREFWKELIPHLSRSRNFAIWPFDGNLGSLLEERGVVLCEIYPGLAYAAALADDLPTGRIKNSKACEKWRSDACDCLARAGWVRKHQVDLGSLDPLRKNDDDFDAHFTAAAVLRCALEGIGLVDANWTDAKVEGSMLLAGAVDPGRTSRDAVRPVPRAHRRANHRTKYGCPIPGCEKIFREGRRGWDAHIGSPRMHPNWHPEVDSPDVRKRIFRAEHGDWFE